ncbi:hypothetical protein [Paraburkholderia nodosa]|uniref:hypothetical protein n=1 Tax=Paraburkholderia nodosa TaxID=392320 RepID=UPI00159F2700|nr:hypothetical protein [Paraburkholderia nodosa]
MLNNTMKNPHITRLIAHPSFGHRLPPPRRRNAFSIDSRQLSQRQDKISIISRAIEEKTEPRLLLARGAGHEFFRMQLRGGFHRLQKVHRIVSYPVLHRYSPMWRITRCPENSLSTRGLAEPPDSPRSGINSASTSWSRKNQTIKML